jgi:ribonuclease Z
MKRLSISAALICAAWLTAPMSMAQAAPCLIVTLTGTQSGPAVFNGQAGAGTLIRYGEESNDCGALKLQFDAGRGTNHHASLCGVAL